MREFGKFGPLIGTVDEGTSNVKFLVFAANTSEVLTYHQVTLKRFSPQEGWIEQDALEILNAVLECIEVTVDNLKKLDIDPEDVVGVGITNQRETTIVWNSATGEPLYSAIVWSDVRTAKIVDDLIKTKGAQSVHAVAQTSGLPLSTYFSSVKLKWLLQNISVVQKAVADGECMAGTVDSWLIWNLTGGSNGGVHATDVTNASRTQLMSLRSLQWDKRLLRFFDIPVQILPKIKSSSEIYGYISTGPLLGTPIAGCLGDQQAALIGQNCMRFGQAKCTFGTGCFLLYNTGESIVHSQNGLLTTVAYQLGPDAPPTYALEGSVAVAGDMLQWLKNGLEIINDLSDSETQAAEVSDDEDSSICFVPAFNGLYSPQWRKDARGVICGLGARSRSAHVCRAALEAVCQQARAVCAALAARGCRCLFSTHYHALVRYVTLLPGLALAHMACMVETEDTNETDDIPEESITFLYKLSPGSCPKSYGFNAARLAGVPRAVTRRARGVALALERQANCARALRDIFSNTDAKKIRDLLSSLTI